MTTSKRSILHLRAEMGADQAELAQEARVSQSLISLVENKKQSLRKDTALQLFYAINRLRAARGFPEIDFEDIEW